MPFVYMDSDCEDEEFGLSFFGEDGKSGHAAKKKKRKARQAAREKAAAHAHKHAPQDPVTKAVEDAIVARLKNITHGAGGHAGNGHMNKKKQKYIISKESFSAMKAEFAGLVNGELGDDKTMQRELTISLMPISKKNKCRKLNIRDVLGSLSTILSKGYRPVSIKKRDGHAEHVWGTWICTFAARGHGKRDKGAEMLVRHFTIHINPVDMQHWKEYTPFKIIDGMTDKTEKDAAKAANRKIAMESDGQWHVSIDVSTKHAHMDSGIPTEAANAAGENNTVAAATSAAPRPIASGIINLI